MARLVEGMSEASLPDFIGVGPPRTGTTWLHNVLRGHVGLPEEKETNFFSSNYDKGIEWYAGLFRHCRPETPKGEFSPKYFATPESPERIHDLIPQCRIICTLRDPVSRLYSHYRLRTHYGWTKSTFAEFVETDSLATESNRYAHYIGAWRKRFGAERIMIALYDDLEDDPQRFLDSICKFIGIAPIALQDSPLLTKRVNRVTYIPRSSWLASRSRRLQDRLRARKALATIKLLRKLGLWRLSFRGAGEFSPIDPELDRRLRERFAPEVAALEELIGRDLSTWKNQKNPASERRTSPKKIAIS